MFKASATTSIAARKAEDVGGLIRNKSPSAEKYVPRAEPTRPLLVSSALDTCPFISMAARDRTERITTHPGRRSAIRTRPLSGRCPAAPSGGSRTELIGGERQSPLFDPVKPSPCSPSSLRSGGDWQLIATDPNSDSWRLQMSDRVRHLRALQQRQPARGLDRGSGPSVQGARCRRRLDAGSGVPGPRGQRLQRDIAAGLPGAARGLPRRRP